MATIDERSVPKSGTFRSTAEEYAALLIQFQNSVLQGDHTTSWLVFS